jgi:hypothetical protein
MFRNILIAISACLLFAACSKSYDVSSRAIYDDLSARVLQPGCSDKLSFEQWQTLLEASDTNRMKSPENIIVGLTTIRDIYAANHDLRGTFPSIYLDISKKLLGYTRSADCRQPEFLNHMIVIFANKLLYNHYNHLQGRKAEKHWEHYFTKADDCEVNKLRVGLGGVNSHIVVDLARSVRDAGAKPGYFHEYMYLGDIMVLAVPDILHHLETLYNIHGSYFLSGFFIGDMIDPMIGEEGATTKTVFQVLRLEAWMTGMAMLEAKNDVEMAAIEQNMFTSWFTKEQAMNEMDRMGLMDE